MGVSLLSSSFFNVQFSVVKHVDKPADDIITACDKTARVGKMLKLKYQQAKFTDESQDKLLACSFLVVLGLLKEILHVF